jgi:hypothetical protein
MNQQEIFYGGGYTMATSNRSPNPSAPAYSSGTSNRQNAGRANQRQLDNLAQQSPSLYGDDRFNSFDGAFRHNRMQQNQGFPDAFMLGNNAAWNYNAATVNGAVAEAAGRLRPSNRRGQIPTVCEWMLPQ